MKRIDIGDSKNVSDQRTGGRTPTRANRNSAALREVNEVPNDQDVANESGFLQHAQLVSQSLPQLIVDLRALAITFFESLVTEIAQICFAGLSRGNRILRIFRAAELDRDVAALPDRERIADCLRKIFEQLTHFRR